jgi:hypothetical protein
VVVVAGLDCVLVILNQMVNEFHGLELAVFVHFVLVDFNKFFYHDGFFPTGTTSLMLPLVGPFLHTL